MQRRRKSIIRLACLIRRNASVHFLRQGSRKRRSRLHRHRQIQRKKSQKRKRGQGNLNIISPQAYSNVDGLTLEPGTYISLIGKEDGTEYWKMVKKGAERAVSELNSALGNIKEKIRSS